MSIAATPEAVTAAEHDRLDREILTLRVALTRELPPHRRSLVAAELQDLRLARVGVHTPRIRVRLDRLGIGATGPRLLWRGPREWGKATRLRLS